MIHVTEKGTNVPLGTISEEQLQYLIDQLEEEWIEDQDYSITPMLITAFEMGDADPDLVKILKDALGDKEEVVIVWRR